MKKKYWVLNPLIPAQKVHKADIPPGDWRLMIGRLALSQIQPWTLTVKSSQVKIYSLVVAPVSHARRGRAPFVVVQ